MTEQLLDVLRAHSTPRGIALGREAMLCDEIGCSKAAIAEGLKELASLGAIEILSPLPFLIARLRGTWPGKDGVPAKSARNADLRPFRAYSFQSSLSQSKPLNESYSSRGAGDLLLQELLTTLGESDPSTFRGALDVYPPAIIRTTLDRVRRMKHVQKSRTALFRFLLPRIAKERHSPT